MTKVWHEKYDCKGELGRGGNAEVFLVVEKETKKDFALKELYNKSREKKRDLFQKFSLLKNILDLLKG